MTFSNNKTPIQQTQLQILKKKKRKVKEDLHLYYSFRITNFSSISNCEGVVPDFQVELFKVDLNDLKKEK